ncbi:MAG: tetratricopeptide (TPR) repeat protein [Myxococcota bacterium]|jgi:tetratricopeptide (TPR) repeat protein
MVSLLTTLILTSAPWAGGDLPTALSAGKPVLVYVQAHWCSPCIQLAVEVLQTPDGKALAEGHTAIAVDFDSDAGQGVVGRFGVITLPTVLLLDARGKELGRVEGYTRRSAWLRSFEDARAGNRSLETLEKLYAEAPGDLDTMVTLAQALLVRKQEVRAKGYLDKAMAKGGSIGARAVRIWGRWLLRVKKEAGPGTQHFLAWALRYDGKPEADQFRVWAAKGLAMQGKRQEATDVLDAWITADPRSEKAVLYKADFMVSHHYDAREAEVAIRAALGLNMQDAWAWYLLAEVLLRQSRRAEAKAAIETAIRRDNKAAIYQGFARQRLGMDIR